MTGTSPWSVRVSIDQVPDAGRDMTIEPDAETRQALAELGDLTGISKLTATFKLTRHGGDQLRVVGRVRASVGQVCVVTLEPITNEIDEAVDLVFVPEGRAAPVDPTLDLPVGDAEDLPEVAPNGVVDLGAVASEFFLLGIDPYPRKPGVVFDVPAAPADPEEHPFAALARLKGRKGPETDR